MRRVAALAASLALLLAACSQPPERHTATIFAMDTVMELTVYGDESVLEDAQDMIYELESRLSVTGPESEIYALNSGASVDLSDDTAALLDSALQICAMTDGALDITVYPLVMAWGFTTGDYRVPEEDEISGLLENVGYDAVSVTDGAVTAPPGVTLDLGAVAKGWAGDKLAALLAERGVESGLFSLGGNIQAVGNNPDGSPWRVGIRDPFGDSYFAVVQASDAAIVTSGGYERYFQQDGVTYCHIIDPSTGRPAVSGLASVTVIGGQGVLCDGLSTAIYVMGLDRAVDLWRENTGFDIVFVTDSREVYITEGIEDSFSLADGYEDMELKVIRRA